MESSLDFNVIRFLKEKKGGCAISPATRDISDWIRFHDLVDLPLRGADVDCRSRCEVGSDEDGRWGARSDLMPELNRPHTIPFTGKRRKN